MSMIFSEQILTIFLHKNTGQCLVCENLWKGRTSTTYKSEKCLEFSPGSWSIFLTRGKRRIYSKGTLVELELHTNQKDSFKKVVEFCDRSVDDFYGGNIVDSFGGNIVDFFDTKMDKWKNSYSVYSVSCPCVVKLISSTELHQNSKFWSESDSPVPLCDSTIYLTCSALHDWAKPAGQDSFFKVFELVLLWCWLPCQLLVPVLVLLTSAVEWIQCCLLTNWWTFVNILNNFVNLSWPFLKVALRGQLSRTWGHWGHPTHPQQILYIPKSPPHPRCSDRIHR